MKKKLLTLLLSAASVAFICNCGDDPASSNNDQTAYLVEKPSFLYNDGKMDYLIDLDGIVTDANGDTVGAADLNTGLIMAMDQTVIGEGVVFTELPTVMPPVVNSTAWVLSTDKTTSSTPTAS